MQLTTTFLANLPFPYFHFDQYFRIISTSVKMKNVKSNLSFTQLLDQQDMDQFIHNFSTLDQFETRLNIEGKFILHQVYKMIDEENDFHLFCYPIMEKFTLEMNGHSEETLFLSNVSKLAAGIAHEIRNPLTTVKGFIQLLKPSLSEIGKGQYADIALDEIDRANDLICEFLDATKPFERKKDKVSLNKIIQDIAILYEGETSLQNVQLTYNTLEDDLIVYGDRKQLKQVLLNIVKNAIEATALTKSEYKQIHISLESKERKANMRIKDNGCGMTEEIRENIFTPFYSTKQTGTGIGLSICKKIIEEHDGFMNICSLPDKGTEITIILPLLIDN